LIATLEFGAFTLQGMMATQEGSVLGQRVFTVGATTSERQDRIVRDLDFESGRFFWAIDPITLPNFPFVDMLNLDVVAIPPAVQPANAQVRVYRYRTGVGGGLNPNLGGITAIGFRPDGPERVEGTWQLLLQGTDYYLDCNCKKSTNRICCSVTLPHCQRSPALPEQTRPRPTFPRDAPPRAPVL
jgi:hypothetical protein